MTAKNSFPWYLLAGLGFTAFNLTHLVAWRFGSYVHVGFFALLLLSVIAFTGKSQRLNVLLISAALVFFTLLILQYPVTEWDARSIWFYHGKRIYYGQDLYAQLDNYPSWNHNDYPSLIPAMAASVARSVGYWNEILPRTSVVAGFAPVLFLTAYVFRSFALICFWTAALIWTCGAELLTGYMDSPLAAYFAISCVLIAKLFAVKESVDLNQQRIEMRNLWLGVGACLVHLLFLKNEGLILSAIVLVMLLPVMRRQWGLVWIPTAAVAFYFLMWWYPVFQAHITNDLVSHGGVLERGVARIQSQKEMILIFDSLRYHTQIFHFAFLALIPTMFLSWQRLKCLVPALLASGLYMGVIFAVYLTTYQNLEWHLNTSASRVVLPFNLTTLTLWIFVLQQLWHKDAASESRLDLGSSTTAASHGSLSVPS